MIKKLLKILNITFTALLAALLCAGLYVAGARAFFDVRHPTVFGTYCAVVVTGSMEPAISQNDFIVTVKRDNYSVGDIVTYREGSATVTHRIVEKTENGFVTKGDANNIEDGEISEERIIGQVVLIIPAVGRVITFFSEPLGMMILVMCAVALLTLPSLFKKK